MLMNRVGDSLLVLSIAFLSLNCSLNTFIASYHGLYYYLIPVLLIGFITKSALFPFSPWLPAAMSAPTPISSLVHSSTLVTAGLYLIIRFSSVLYCFPDFMLFLVIVRVFTTFYAGLNSLVETDLKKLIALSTLSHLGFIGLAIGTGFDYLAVFHLFTHALFKSLIFIALGEIISFQSHYQDIRFLSSGLILTPVSRSYIYMSSLSLFGLPFVRGFYSKDFILESFHYSYYCRGVLTFVIYLNLVFTYVYTSRVMSFCMSSIKTSPYFTISLPLFSHLYHIITLSFISILFGYLFVKVLFFGGVSPVVPLFRSLPFLLLTFVFLTFIRYSKSTSFSPFITFFFGSMLFLAPFTSNFVSKQSYSSLLSIAKTVEHGMLHSSRLQFPSLVIVSCSRLF